MYLPIRERVQGVLSLCVPHPVFDLQISDFSLFFDDLQLCGVVGFASDQSFLNSVAFLL